MNIRLVAYRKATSASTSDTAYNLDLQEAPNVSLNFQFSDIKEPESRKGSYSQTFKLPFTDNNNSFFQNWFNVNLETLVFNTRKKFEAVLYVGSVPQFEGFIQLKSVYQKAQVYEIVLMSNTATLFSTIGEQKLKDVFLLDSGAYSDELNHTFSYTDATNNTLFNSWNGSSSAFVNSSGVSLRDTTVNVQKVMYPTSVTQPNFYYADNVKQYLNMSATDIANATLFPDGVTDAFQYIVPIVQFRPAIQLKTMLKLIIARAGFSYTSAFIDGSYFGKLFMTTGNHIGQATMTTTTNTANPSGLVISGNNGAWGQNFYTGSSTTDVCQEVTQLFEADTDVEDEQGLWNTTSMYFTKAHPTMASVEIRHRISFSNLAACNGDMTITAIVQDYDVANNTPNPSVVWSFGTPQTFVTSSGANFTHELDLSLMPTGSSAQVILIATNFKPTTTSSVLTLGSSASFTSQNLESKFKITWEAYTTGIFGNVVDVPSLIDDSITQKDFLKDLIERFNLIVAVDPEDAGNLIIEPYNDYLALGDIKYWTDKLDTSKEIIVTDTTSLQKKTVKFGDLEDIDLGNKTIKENYPNINPYGKLEITETNNDFATGELTNNPIFSPYINSRIYKNNDTQTTSQLVNFTVQYEFTYEEVDGGFENPLKATKPKLFYYNGAPTTVIDEDGGTTTYYMHNQPVSGFSIDTYSFTTYPTCTPFDITPGAGSNPANTFTLTPDTKSLYWNSTPPLVGQLEIFNYENDNGSWFNNTLYGYYWKPYLDSIYNTDARIMECYLNLNSVDIFNFKFNDEIFIKDTYWRILNISNYQVGAEASTKVTLIKVVDSLIQCESCDYVLGYDSDGNNTFYGFFYIWCDETNPGCTPDITAPNYLGLYTDPSCCICNGGIPFYWATAQASNGLYPCLAQSGSLPLNLQSLTGALGLLEIGQVKTIINNKIGGLTRPLIRGIDNTKYSTPILPYYGDDIIIKYNTKRKGTPQLQGESHRIVLSGFTEGNTKSFGFPEGSLSSTPLVIPTNTNVMIQVKGIATVIGGTSSSYVVGITESFAYHTAFKNVNGTITQIGVAGGVVEWSLKEVLTTCTLYIDVSGNVLRFGIQDSQTDTKRVWALTADIAIQRLHNLTITYNENWALFQNGRNIQFQNGDYLLWN